MANDSFDPKSLAEYAGIMQQIQAILQDIVEKNQAINLTEAEKNAKVSEGVGKFQQLIETKFREVELSGQSLDNEQKRNLLLQQYRDGLQQRLAQLTTEHYKNEEALKKAGDHLNNINNQLSTMGQRTAQNAARFDALTNEQVKAEQVRDRLASQRIQMLEAERRGIINNITAEMQYADAKVRSSQQAQSSLTALLGLDNKWRQTLAGSMAETAAAAMRARGVVAGLIETMSHLSSTLSNVGSFGNVVGSTIEKIQETTITMITQIDRADVGLRSATGASKEFAKGLTAAFEDEEIRAMAGAYDELSQINQRLWSVASSFTGLLPTQQEELVKTALAAKRMGISYDVTAAVAEKSFRVFGIQGPSMMNRLYNSAIAIGEAPSNMVRNFTQAVDVMAQYSLPRAMEVLQGLSAIAKTTGIEVSRLTSIAMRFDTFEDAANNVAKLNAILGGAYYNSIQMLNASEEQRLYLLRAGLDATNRSWESLGRWEKKAMAAAAGFKDMNIAAAFFQGNMSKVAELTRVQEEQADSQRRMIMMGGQLVDIFQQIKRVFQDAGFLGKDLVNVVRDIVGVMKKLGFEGMVTAGLLVGFVNTVTTAVIQSRMFAAAVGGSATALGTLGTSLIGLAPMLLAAGAAWLYFSDKMREEKSPPAYSLAGIIASQLQQMGPAAEEASIGLGHMQNKIATLNDKKVINLTRALGMISQVSVQNLNFAQVTLGVGELTRAVNNLDEKKVNAFANAMGRLGAVMQTIPRENVIAVTQLTKESRMIAALPVAAAARQGAQISAQGSAVRAARASESPGGGGRGGGMEGVLVTDSISVNVGGTVLTQRIKDTVRSTFERYERKTG